MEIRELAKTEYGAALELAWKVFLEFEAPDYPQQGTDSFHAAICDPEYTGRLCIYGACEAGEIVGVLATRSEGAHIALFFVDGRYHRRGVGKRLFQRAAADNKNGKLTVNSSPYAVEAYMRMGFKPVDAEQIKDGIRFTPMECILRNTDCPCKKSGCERHGDCVSCREHHKNMAKATACERAGK